MQRNLNNLQEYRVLYENGENKIGNLSQVITKGTVAAAGINVNTPIITAIIGNLTGTLPTEKKHSKQIKCKLCNCSVSSQIILQRHISGTKHQKKLKDLEVFNRLNNGENHGVQILQENQSFPFMCKICPLAVNSANQLQNHLSGERHRKNVDRLKSFELEKNEKNKSEKLSKSIHSGATVEQNVKKNDREVFPCQTCNISLNSKIQYNEHMNSKKHRTKEAVWQRFQQPIGKEIFLYRKNPKETLAHKVS